MLSEVNDHNHKPRLDELHGTSGIKLLRTLALPAVLIDLEGRIRYWSRAVADLTGYDADVVTGGPIQAIALAAEDDAIASLVVQDLLHQGSWAGEFAVLGAAGEAIRLHVHASVLYDADDQAAAVVAVLSDVTQASETARRASKLQSQLKLAEGVGLGCWDWDVATDRLTTSPAFLDLLGLAPSAELTMGDALAAMVPEDRERVVGVLDGFRRDPSQIALQYRLRGADGDVVWLEAHCVGVASPTGELVAVRGTTIDITQRMKDAERLRAAADFWQGTLDSLTAHVAVLDEAGTIVAVNEKWRAFSTAEGTGDDWIGADYLAACDAAEDELAHAIAAGLRDVLAGRRDSFEAEYPCHSPAAERWFLLRATTCCTESGPPRVVVAHEPITDLHLAQRRLALQAALLDEMNVSVISTDMQLRVQTWNAGAARLYGWDPDEAIGRRLPELIFPAEALERGVASGLEVANAPNGERLRRRKDGSTVTVDIRTRLIKPSDDTPPSVVGVAMDVTARKAAERALINARNYLRAVTDHMGDGLYTLDADGRLIYMNQVAHDLLGWSPEDASGTAFHELIHHHVDPCPIAQAHRDRQVARVSDDVFVRRDGTRIAVAYTAAPFETEDGTDGCVVVFQDITARKAEAERMHDQLEKLSWLGRVRDAIAEQRFVLHAQPIIETATGAVAQRELLIRMRDPSSAGESGQLILPGVFLPIAEEYGLIADIDRWVVDQATALSARGQAVELNVSARSITDPLFVEHVRRALERTGADPARLVFEITETALISDQARAMSFVRRMHELGCKVALDDFGTGYGGFTYLKHLPIDYLKIDIEFVRDLRDNSASRNVVEAVVSLARGFGIETVAEGVEDAETLAILGELGVDHAQGYYIGRPAPVD